MSVPTPAAPYLALDGGDGCGKSAQAKTLCEWLQRRGQRVLHVREPGSTPVGEALRQLLLSKGTGELRPITEALLFSAARSELVTNVIEPARARGELVIAERCYLSTIVYQSLAALAAGTGESGTGASGGGASGIGLDLDWLFDLARRVHGPCLPDRIFVLDVAPAIAAQRRRARTADRFEGRGDDWHTRVRDGYLRAAALEPRALVIDAGRAFAAVQDDLRARVQELLA